MKRNNNDKKKLLLNVEKVRRLTLDDKQLQAVVGGAPCLACSWIPPD